MSLFDALFGRTKLRKPDMDRIFALSTAAPVLAETAAVAPGGAASVCLQPVEGADFARAEVELRELANLACRDKDFHASVEVSRDQLGYTWIVFKDDDLSECVTLVHLMGTTLQQRAYGEQLLAAMFRLRPDPPDAAAPQTVYLIYNYKRGTFYPFVPQPGHTRDNAAELRLSGALGGLVPVERDLTRWFPLWDCPL